MCVCVCVCVCMFVCMFVCNSLTSTEPKTRKVCSSSRQHSVNIVSLIMIMLLVRILFSFRSCTLCTTADTACNELYCVVCLTLSLSDLHIIVIPIIPCKFRDVPLFTATCSNCLPGTCFSAANCLCKEVNALQYLYVFRNILHQSFPF